MRLKRAQEKCLYLDSIISPAALNLDFFNKINSLSFKDVDTKNKKDINFDIDVYLNTEFKGDSTLNSEQLEKELDITLHKLKIHHNILPVGN